MIISEIAKKKKCFTWVREWILGRETEGAYNQLMFQLIIEDLMQFSNFVHMKISDFDNLTIKIDPLLLKQDTNF